MKKIFSGFSILIVLLVLTACNISGWSTYTNTTYNFQLQYPPGGSIATGAHDTFAYIALPFPSGTNLAKKYMDINVQDGVPTCESPWAVGLAPLYLTTANITIHGTQWLQQTYSNHHGASKFVDLSAYSTVNGSVCVSLTFNLLSSNPQIYATPIPTYSPNESLVFPLIVATFQWLNGGATTPTREAQFVIRSTPTLVTTLTPSEMPASVFTPLPSDTPTSSALIFTPAVSPLEFNYYHPVSVLACIVKNPQVDISVMVSDPSVHGVVLFFRLKNKADGAETAWNAGVNMNPQGNGVFDISLSANQIPNLSAISASGGSAWLEYQFAATDALGGTIGRSPVYSNVSLTPCQG